MKRLLLLCLFLTISSVIAQQETVVQTFTFDDDGRSEIFEFPDGSTSYRKILMQYRMRCKDGLISNGANPNQGCGEWDYSCNTYITDPTRIDSTKATHPSHIISGFSGTTFNYTTQPTYTYYQSTQEEVTYTNTISETVATIGTGSVSSNIPFNNPTVTGRTQYLITAAELSGGGLSAGNLTGLRVNVDDLGSTLTNLRIKIKATSATALDTQQPELDGFTTVYYLNTTFSATGMHQFNFSNNFSWNGTSNIIVEFTYDQTTGAASSVQSTTIANHGISAINHNDFGLEFDGGGKYVELTNPLTIGSTSSTIETWVKVPVVGTGGLSSNERVGNIIANYNSDPHFNYEISSDGFLRIYWNGGEINTYGTTDLRDGQWHHVAFVRDKTANRFYAYIDGVLDINFNGVGTDITLTNPHRIGADHRGSNTPVFHGEIDELRIWDTARTSVEISNNMHTSISAANPSYTNLLSYYNFNEGTGTVLNDTKGNNHGTLVNNPIWRTKKGEHLIMDFSLLSERPNFEVLQGVYTTSSTTTTITDALINPANTVEEYIVDGTDIILNSTNQYYESGDMPVYDESGNIIDNVVVAAEGAITIVDLDYYRKYDAKIELMSFVTPYGLGLDLGEEGRMWEFDVTDFTTVLRGSKNLSVELSGAYQEDLDIRFIFIEGTPPRDVLDLQHVWRAGTHRSYTDLISNRYFEPRDIALNPNASMFRLRTAITGHGQEGEFIPRTHFLNVNGGANEVSWQVWKECADNPIYPQGGTWIYDRAGWCPGAPTDVNIYELDPSQINNSSINLDYGLITATGTSNYLISCQLVSYGDPNFTNDASIIDVKNPSLKTEYLRINPACSYPVVTIQNTGSNELTSLDINYQIEGGTGETFSWTGQLAFLEKEDVTLPIPDLDFWNGTNNVFNVTISNANGTADQYADNNSLSSPFEFPDSYGENFIIELRTNNLAFQNSYVIRDYDGNVVFTKSGLSNNTTYTDTMTLADGCYTLELIDTGDNGLSFWAQPSQGNGYMRLRSILDNSIIKTFEPDCGSGFNYAFSVGEALSIDDLQSPVMAFNIFPNPANESANIVLTKIHSEQLTIKVFNLFGVEVFSRDVNTLNTGEYYGTINTSSFSSGTYFIEVADNKSKIVKKLIVGK